MSQAAKCYGRPAAGQRLLRLSVVPLLLAAGTACSTVRVKSHPEEVAALATWPASPDRQVTGFVPVEPVDRSGVPAATEDAAAYLLGPGDVLRVTLLPPAELPGLAEPFTGTVRPDGLLYLPQAGKMKAAGKTATELEDAIVEALTPQIAKPLISVEVREFHARRCRIVGEGVPSEQFVSVDGKTTLLEALITSGATQSDNADRDEAYLIRAGTAYPFSITTIVDSADPAGQSILMENDHIVVPSVHARQDYVYVFGQVLTPTRVPMDHTGRAGSRGRITLTGAVGSAGGIREETADCTRICLFRGGWRDVRVFHLSVPEFYRYGESIALEPGDRIYVAATDAARFNMSLQQFLPSVTGASGLTGLFLSAAALAK